MSDTDKNSLRTLQELVFADPALQARLFALTDANAFIAEVLLLAQSHGLPLCEETLRQALNTGRTAWRRRNPPCA